MEDKSPTPKPPMDQVQTDPDYEKTRNKRNIYDRPSNYGTLDSEGKGSSSGKSSGRSGSSGSGNGSDDDASGCLGLGC